MAKTQRGQPDQRLDALNKVLQAVAETRDYLLKCADCHINVDREMRQNAEQEEIARRIKATFYPLEK